MVSCKTPCGVGALTTGDSALEDSWSQGKKKRRKHEMKSHKPSKLIALGLALTMGLSIPAALAASSLVPASTKVTVDGKAAAVEGYNIDNGNNYYKLRDFASALDVGLTWDKATDTAAIDTGSHYKPDATQLITGNWAPATRARIQAVIDENANQGKYVVFDFDNTSVIFDIQEALLIYQIENLQFKIDPADMEAVLETGIPDLNKSMGTSLDGKNITPATLVADITSDYEWIYANYEGFEGDKDLNYIHASNQYQDFAAKLRFMYGNLGDYFDHAVSYPWVGYLFTGMTPDEVQELAAASHQYWADYGRYAEETWTSPVELPGKTGIVSIDFITGLTFTDELKDLYATLQANGIEVYIVSASPIDTVLAPMRPWATTCPRTTSTPCATSWARTAATSTSITTTGAARASTPRPRVRARAPLSPTSSRPSMTTPAP